MTGGANVRVVDEGVEAPVAAGRRLAPELAVADVCVVIAAYREGAVIADVVRELRANWPTVVVVDDGSDDETEQRAREAGAIVLRHVINRGQGAALQTGISYALRIGAQIIVTYDADGQHRAEAVEDLVRPIVSGQAEAVFGSRFIQDASDIPWARRCLLRAAVLFTRLTTGAHVTDAHNGLRAFDRRTAERVQLRLDRMAHASEIIDQLTSAGVKYVEVPVAVRYTAYSRAKGQSGAAALRILWDYMLSKVIS